MSAILVPVSIARNAKVRRIRVQNVRNATMLITPAFQIRKIDVKFVGPSKNLPIIRKLRNHN